MSVVTHHSDEATANDGYGRSWAEASDLESFDRFVDDFHAGRLSPDDFKRFRLQMGVYGQRQTDVQMIRLKIPWGGLTAAQLESLADAAGHTPRGVGHVTTRQNFQFHFVPLTKVPGILRDFADAGLTTREACGNAIRNVTVGHCAGVCPTEIFDPTPYADALARFFLRNPMNQNLPRKFKIAFSGCADDSGLTAIHDIGARAVVRTVNGRRERGFTLLIGGGLGPAPQVAQAVEEFTPVDDLLVTAAAIVKVFDRQGNRDNRNLARLKFVVKKLGIDAVRTLIFKERDALRFTMAGLIPPVELWEESPPAPRPTNGAGRLPRERDAERWLATSVVRQKQAGWVSVNVRLVRGDATADQLRAVAHVARAYGDGNIRATNQQNLALRWIPLDALGAVYASLAEAGLASPGAERLVDVTTCPGADTCQLGITSSRGLALALTEMIERDLGDLADDAGVRIKISGCPNSCGQHHLAGIGLYGGARKFHGDAAPTYQLLVGGRVGVDTRFAKPIARVPARLVPDAVRTLLGVYRRDRAAEESFDAFVTRTGFDRLADLVSPWTELPPATETPDAYVDWDGLQKFTLETGAGECAA